MYKKNWEAGCQAIWICLGNIRRPIHHWSFYGFNKMACKLWLFIASLKVWTFFVERAINTDKKRPNSNFSQTYLQVIGFLCVFDATSFDWSGDVIMESVVSIRTKKNPWVLTFMHPIKMTCDTFGGAQTFCLRQLTIFKVHFHAPYGLRSMEKIDHAKRCLDWITAKWVVTSGRKKTFVNMERGWAWPW